jgi:preprotein translocase subunit SecG
MISNLLNIILGINSLIIIFLILNQNESTKETSSNVTNVEISNPLQNITWVCIFFEFLLFLIKTKINSF